MIRVNHQAGQHIVSNELYEMIISDEMYERVGKDAWPEYCKVRETYVDTDATLEWLHARLGPDGCRLVEGWLVEIYDGDAYVEHHKSLGLPVEQLDSMSTYEVDGTPVTIINADKYRHADADYERVELFMWDFLYHGFLRDCISRGDLKLDQQNQSVSWKGVDWQLRNEEARGRRQTGHLLDHDLDASDILLHVMVELPWEREALARTLTPWSIMLEHELNDTLYTVVKDWYLELVDTATGLFDEESNLTESLCGLPVGLTYNDFIGWVNLYLKEEDQIKL